MPTYTTDLIERRSHYWHQKSIVNVIHKLVTYQGMCHLRGLGERKTVPVRFKTRQGTDYYYPLPKPFPI